MVAPTILSQASSLWKTAIVTGAAQGIGRAIALRLARDGHRVALVDVEDKEDVLMELKEQISRNGVSQKIPSVEEHEGASKVEVIAADVTEVDDVRGMVRSVVQKMGRLDIMVANAGIVKPMVPFLDATICDWDTTMAVNARGTFLCYRFAAQQMVKQGSGGRIVGASSVLGKRGDGRSAAYSASKFAVRGLTQSAADSLGKYGITVNAYAPGYISTPMTHNAVIPSLGFNKPGEAFEKVGASASVLGRTGNPEDIASWVSYIVSDEAWFITGQTVSIDGGMYFG